jgi:hypothetical protein
MKRRDVNEIAFSVVQQAIGAIPKEREKRKAEAAKLGRAGGIKGGKARKKVLSAARRTEIAKKAAATRWAKKKSRSSRPAHKAP